MKIPESLRPISKSISAVIERKTELTKALALPLAIYLALMLLIQSSIDSLGVTLVVFIVTSMLYVTVSVTIHRAIIIDERNAPFAVLISFGAREVDYVLALVVSVLCCLPSLVFLLIPDIGGYIATAAGAYILSRISLMFPSIATDAPLSVEDSWRVTKNNQIMMLAVVSLFPAFFSALKWGMSKLSVPSVLLDIFSLFTIVFVVSVLSEAYKTIMAKLTSDKANLEGGTLRDATKSRLSD